MNHSQAAAMQERSLSCSSEDDELLPVIIISSTREASPIRTAFANLLEQSFESKLNRRGEDEEEDEEEEDSILQQEEKEETSFTIPSFTGRDSPKEKQEALLSQTNNSHPPVAASSSVQNGSKSPPTKTTTFDETHREAVTTRVHRTFTKIKQTIMDTTPVGMQCAQDKRNDAPPLSNNKQVEHTRVPLMRMRHPAVQDFVAIQKDKEDAQQQHFKQQQNIPNRRNKPPDDIIACNNGLWKGIESFVVTRCGDVSDVLVDPDNPYSVERSLATDDNDDNKSEDTNAMMRRLSKLYLKKGGKKKKKDALQGDASQPSPSSSSSSCESRRLLTVPMTGTSPEYTIDDRRPPPPPPAPPIQASLGDKHFVQNFIQKAQNEGLDLLIHRKVRNNDLAGPVKARAFLRDGKKGIGGDFTGPWLEWYTKDSQVQNSIDLFDIRSLDKATALQLEQYPLAIPGRSLVLRMNEGSDHVFEMHDESSAIQFVHGMRWAIARLSFNLIIGNVHVSCEMLEVKESPSRSPVIESNWNSAMNDLTNHLVDKSAAAM